VRHNGRVAVLAGLLVCLVLAFPSISSARQLGSPVRVAVMSSGHVLVTDHYGNRVVEWDPSKNKVVRSIDVLGIPDGLAWGWGKIFVGNQTTQSVEVYSRTGKLLSVLGGVPGLVSRPNDIAVDSDAGLVFVLDAQTRLVQVYGSYDSGGALLYTIPAPGAKPLHRPASLTVDPARREVLVSDFGEFGSFGSRALVNIYDYDGNYLGEISTRTQLAEYRFSAPQGLTVNGLGQVYLVDSMRGQVLVFDRETLRGVATIGEAGRAPGNLLFPLDVEIDGKTSDVYVTNYRLGRLEVFIGMGVSP
jgi:DNA-binding beta-propeller fold protein YncE